MRLVVSWRLRKRGNESKLDEYLVNLSRHVTATRLVSFVVVVGFVGPAVRPLAVSCISTYDDTCHQPSGPLCYFVPTPVVGDGDFFTEATVGSCWLRHWVVINRFLGKFGARLFKSECWGHPVSRNGGGWEVSTKH